MRKKKVIAFIALFLLLAVAVVICLRPAPKLQVIGTLPAKDLAEIKRLVNQDISQRNHDMWRGVYQGLSWQTVKRISANIETLAFVHIQTIDAAHEPFVLVMVGAEKKPGGTTRGGYVYFMRKGADGWDTIVVMPGLAVRPNESYPFYPAPDWLPATERGGFR